MFKKSCLLCIVASCSMFVQSSQQTPTTPASGSFPTSVMLEPLPRPAKKRFEYWVKVPGAVPLKEESAVLLTGYFTYGDVPRKDVTIQAPPCGHAVLCEECDDKLYKAEQRVVFGLIKVANNHGVTLSDWQSTKFVADQLGLDTEHPEEDRLSEYMRLLAGRIQ